MTSAANRTPLPIVTCDGCGACCTHVGTPPGAFPMFASGEEPRPGYFARVEGFEYALWLARPAEVRQELTDYYRAALRDRTIPDRSADRKTPCLWYDPAPRRCRHYDFRPEACREFEPGEDSCLDHRRRCGVQ